MFELHRATFSERRGQSLLGTILAGNYSSFEVQRDRLKRVHEGRWALDQARGTSL